MSMGLSLLGQLVDPTNQYTSKTHKKFSECLVSVIKVVVSSVTPASFTLLALFFISWWRGWFDPIPISLDGKFWFGVLVLWTIIEVIFYWYCYVLKTKFGPKISFPQLTSEQRKYYLTRVLEHCDDPWYFLVGWFPNHSKEQIGRECLDQWLSWAFFSKDVRRLTSYERKELLELGDEVVKKCPKIGRPSAPSIKFDFMKLHMDDMVFQHKPWIAYLVISIMQYAGSLYLSHIGFKHMYMYNSPMSYWSYEPQRQIQIEQKNKHPQEKPIFVVHGIGIGIAMYFKLVKSLVSTHPQRSIYILELPHISLKVQHSVPSVDETLKVIDYIYQHHNLVDCSWIAHSYGTIVTAWVLKERFGYVGRLTFVDPIPFQIWQPDLIYNFLYKCPSTPIEKLCSYFVSQDLLVSYTLFRNFWWLQNSLFPEDVKCPSNIFISSHDFIINPVSTIHYLNKYKPENMEIHKMNNMSHGGFLNSSKYITKIVSKI